MKTTKDQKNYIGRDLEAMSVATNYYRWLIRYFRRFLGKNIVEVGAGSGTFSEYLLATDPENFYAVEPSEEMYPLLKDRLEDRERVYISNSYLSEVPKDFFRTKADTFLYINVLEHVEHDLEEMKLAHSLLEENGVVCIYVPALQALYGAFDEQVGHYRRYSKATLRKVLEEAGFKVERLHYSDIFGILPWIIFLKFFKKKDLYRQEVSLYDKLVIPVVAMLERFIKPPVGKNLFAVARKV